MRDNEQTILQELEALCRECQSLQSRFDMDARRRTIRNLIVTRVFNDYCRLYWKKDDIKKSGLELSNSIMSVLKNFNPAKSEFSHYLNSAIKNAIQKGRQNEAVGDSENLKVIRRDTVTDNDTVLGNELSPEIDPPRNTIDGNILEAINHKWAQEKNEKHKRLISMHLNSTFYEFNNYGELCKQYECLSLTCKEFNPSLQKQEMASLFGIEKSHASNIIKRFFAKMPEVHSALKKILQDKAIKDLYERNFINIAHPTKRHNYDA